MRDILDRIGSWHDEGHRFASVTVIDTWSSAPRPVGASMAVRETGEVVGSVSGGCVEGALYALAQAVLESGVPAVDTYGISGDDAFAVGLTCDGTLRVLVEPVGATTFPNLELVRESVSQRKAVAVATRLDTRGIGIRRIVLTSSGLVGSLGNAAIDRSLSQHMSGLLGQGKSRLVGVGRGEEHCDPTETVFVESPALDVHLRCGGFQ